MKNLKRWRIPPPPALELDAPDGAEVLAENPARLGMVFWDGVRDVLRWTECSWRERSDLRDPVGEVRRLAAIASTGADERVTRSLELVTRTLGDPARVDAELLSLGCTYLSSWAEQHGALATAAVWAHAAACVCPGNPQLAYKAGRLARRRADYARAEEWLTRAVLLGRQVGDWETNAAGLAGLGNVFSQRGNYPRARKYHHRCLRAARQHDIRNMIGVALHELCVDAIQTGQMDQVLEFGRGAHQAYGNKHPKLWVLAHDVAYAWLNEGWFSRSIEVFDAVLPHCTRLEEQVLIVANTARAAAGTGDLARFELAWENAMTLLSTLGTGENVAQALLDLAQGASLISEWGRAENAARRALEISTWRREARIQITAESVLDSILRETAVHKATEYCADPELTNSVNCLAADFVESLSGRAVAAT